MCCNLQFRWSAFKITPTISSDPTSGDYCGLHAHHGVSPQGAQRGVFPQSWSVDIARQGLNCPTSIQQYVHLELVFGNSRFCFLLNGLIVMLASQHAQTYIYIYTYTMHLKPNVKSQERFKVNMYIYIYYDAFDSRIWRVWESKIKRNILWQGSDYTWISYLDLKEHNWTAVTRAKSCFCVLK